MRRMVLFKLWALLSSGLAFAGTDKVLLDVRTEAEWKEKHLTDEAIDFKKPDFKQKLAKLDKSKHYQLFCRTGNRSEQAERIMKEMGFRHVENVGSLEDAQKLTGRTCVGPACGK